MGSNRVISLWELDKQDGMEGWDGLAAPPRPIMHKVSYPPRLSLNGLLIAAIMTTLLVVAGFMPLALPSPLNLLNDGNDWMGYSFQLPLALFIGAFLGPFLGSGSILLFLLGGLLMYPVFANGGGLTYVLQPGFGYLAGMLALAYLNGKTFHKVFQKHEAQSRSLKLLAVAASSVVVVHLLGLIYLTGLAVSGQVAWGDWPGYALRLSLEPFAYDLAATALLLCLVRQLRLCLWVVLY